MGLDCTSNWRQVVLGQTWHWQLLEPHRLAHRLRNIGRASNVRHFNSSEQCEGLGNRSFLHQSGNSEWVFIRWIERSSWLFIECFWLYKSWWTFSLSPLTPLQISRSGHSFITLELPSPRFETQRKATYFRASTRSIWRWVSRRPCRLCLSVSHPCLIETPIIYSYRKWNLGETQAGKPIVVVARTELDGVMPPIDGSSEPQKLTIKAFNEWGQLPVRRRSMAHQTWPAKGRRPRLRTQKQRIKAGQMDPTSNLVRRRLHQIRIREPIQHTQLQPARNPRHSTVPSKRVRHQHQFELGQLLGSLACCVRVLVVSADWQVLVDEGSGITGRSCLFVAGGYIRFERVGWRWTRGKRRRWWLIVCRVHECYVNFSHELGISILWVSENKLECWIEVKLSKFIEQSHWNVWMGGIKGWMGWMNYMNGVNEYMNGVNEQSMNGWMKNQLMNGRTINQLMDEQSTNGWQVNQLMNTQSTNEWTNNQRMNDQLINEWKLNQSIQQSTNQHSINKRMNTQSINEHKMNGTD